MEKIDPIYFYSKLPDNDFDKNILNQEFKTLLEKIDENNQEQFDYNFLLKYALFLSDNLDQNIEQNLEKFEQILQKFDSKTIFRVFFTLQGLFLKEAYLGPSFTYASIEKRLKQEKQERSQQKKQKKFPFYDFSKLVQEKNLDVDSEHLDLIYGDIKNLNFYNYKFVKQTSLIFRQEKAFQEFLEVDGEQWARLIPYTSLFIVFRHIINFLEGKRENDSIFFKLWAGRVAYFHNNILFTPTGTLKERVNEMYEKFFEEVFKTNPEKYNYVSVQQKMMVNCEFSNVLLFFYQYNASKQRLNDAQNLMKISFNFTGKMGVRTKFQTFKVAQLVVEVDNKEEQEEVDKENAQTLNPYQFLNSNPDQIKSEKFDEECILYETPKLDETEEKNYKSDLSIYEQILLIAIMKNLEISNTHDEVYQEQAQAYCNLLVDKSLNWLVFTNSLFIRSVNEFEKFKRMERAILQLQTLIDQFNEKQPEFLQRSLYFYPLVFPSQLELTKMVATRYMKVGMMKTACDLFEKLEMYEEAVECLAGSSMLSEAKEMGRKHLELNPNNPKMLCIMGDICRDFTYYKKAWKVSNKRFARAQRSLGQYYFYQNNYEKAVKAFRKAVAINTLVIEPWFTMGCAYLKLNESLKAIRSFSQVVTINNAQGDAWANMANAYLNLGKREEAFSTLEQAVKHNESSWKMWSNLMQVSFMTKKFYKFFECIQRIITLGKGLEIIDKTVLRNLNQVFAYQIQLLKKATHKSPFVTMKRRIERLYALMAEKMGQQPAVWEFFADFMELCQTFLQVELFLDKQTEKNKQKESESSTQTAGKVRFAETTKLYKTEQELLDEFSINTQKLKQRVYDYRLSACNVLMVSGWEDSKQICEFLLPLVEELIVSHKEADRGEAGDIEIKRFLQTVAPQIEKNLEKKIKFEFDY